MIPIQVRDNHLSDRELTDQELEALQPFVGKAVAQLAGETDLLVLPHDFKRIPDGISSSTLFTFCGRRLSVGNVIGFWGVGEAFVNSRSRFDSDDRQYFFHYMLQRVLGVHLVNWQAPSNQDSVWDFLIYLFPALLKRAYRQGMFRAYRTARYNDDRIRGGIDVSRHICMNIPFAGRVAYSVREYATNNPVNQLVRHVIEEVKARCPVLLTGDVEIRMAVRAIQEATPDYCRFDRRKVIVDNLKPVRHPYLTEYTILQKLCLQILRHEKVSFGRADRKLKGVIFDASWIWEEYLATLLKPQGILHPENKTGRGGIDMYCASPHFRCYPDFIWPNRQMILDAKYKRVDEQDGIAREDRFQLISYLHITQFRHGVILYPTTTNAVQRVEGSLRGHGGQIGAIPLRLPVNESYGVNFSAYSKEMSQRENDFLFATARFQ